jgi:predicted  nucleic acid-binding Zn-ribbon protein
MSSRHSWLRVSGVVLGGIGLAICLASLLALWMVSARVARVAERGFGELEETLVTIGQRVEKTQDRFREAKLTTEDVKSSLGEWAEREAAQRVASQLQVAEKAKQVADSMQRADNLLEVAASLAKLVDHAMSMGASSDAPGDAASKGGLNVEIASVRKRLDDARDDVARVQEQIDSLSAETPAPEIIEQAAQSAVRFVASLDWMNARLEQTTERLAATQTRLRDYAARTQRWTTIVNVGLTSVVTLMALGQIALCRLAWIGGRSAD